MSFIVNFLKRHKRKFLFGGGLITGIFLVKKYAQHRLLEWHNKETLMLLKKQKRKQHYESSKQTAQAAVLSIAETLSKTIMEELDSESILVALHQKPSNKQSLWEELKVVAFSQILCSIYLSAIVVTTIHVKLMVLSGYSFSMFSKINPRETPENQHSIQELYMASIQEFIQKGIPILIRKIQRVVTQCIDNIALTRLVSIDQLEMILHDICLELDGEFLGNGNCDRNRSRLRPWGQYSPYPSGLEGAAEGEIVKELLSEARDIIDSEDFNAVIEGLIQQGLNQSLDCVAESFPLASINNNPDNMQSEHSDNSESTENPTQHSPIFSKSTLPIAKLIPIFSGSVHNLLSLGPGHLLVTLLQNNRLEAFCNNVYSAFCTDVAF